MRTYHARSWFLGLTLGFASVFVVDVMGVRGLVFPAVSLLALASVARPRLTGVAGLLAGFGALWSFLFSRLELTCGVDAFFPDPNCSTDDLTLWIMGSAVILLAGLVLSAVAVRRAR